MNYWPAQLLHNIEPNTTSGVILSKNTTSGVPFLLVVPDAHQISPAKRKNTKK